MKNITITPKCLQNQKHVEILKNRKKRWKTQKISNTRKNIQNMKKRKKTKCWQWH